MDSTLVKILYTNAFNDIESARNCQISISQNEMELQMININSKYSSFDNSYLNTFIVSSQPFIFSNILFLISSVIQLILLPPFIKLLLF